MGNGIIREVDFDDSIIYPTYQNPVTVTSEVNALNCFNKKIINILSIKGKTIVNLLGSDGDCEDTSKWTAYQSTLALDSSNKVFGSNGIKVTSTTTSGATTLYKSGWGATILQPNSYYCITAYIKNGTMPNALTAYVTNCTGITTGYQSSTTDTTKFSRIITLISTGASITGGDLDIGSSIGATAIGQYYWVDGIQVEQITSSQYALGSLFVPSPYVNSDMSVGDVVTRVKSRTRNLLNLVQGGFSDTTSGIIYTSSNYNRLTHKDGAIPVKSNTTYTITLSSALSYRYTEFDSNRSITNQYNTNFITNASTSITINTTSNTKYIGIAFKVDDTATPIYPENYQIMLNEGSTALPYEKYDETYAPIQYSLKSLPNGVADEIVNNKWLYPRVTKMALDGSLNWQFDYSFTGYKSVKIPTSVFANMLSNSVINTFKYNIKTLSISSSTSNGADLIIINTDYTYITISNTDSGWGDYTPTAQEIQAYFWGWRMWDGTSRANPYNGTGTKNWYTINSINTNYDSARNTTTCPTSVATDGYIPYRLYYQNATVTPVELNMPSLVAYPNGDLIMESDSQSWVRPTITYQIADNEKANMDEVMKGLSDSRRLSAEKRQENWIVPTLLNGWSNYSSGWSAIGYFKDSLGVVHLKGLIKGGTMTSGTILFTLPQGYRPSENLLISTQSSVNSTQQLVGLTVSNVGNVSLNYTITQNAWFILDGISFRAEQ